MGEAGVPVDSGIGMAPIFTISSATAEISPAITLAASTTPHNKAQAITKNTLGTLAVNTFLIISFIVFPFRLQPLVSFRAAFAPVVKRRLFFMCLDTRPAN